MRPWIAALLLAGCASAPPRQPPPPPAPPGAPEVRAVRVAVSPIVDGSADVAEWGEAPDTEIPLGQGDIPSCRMKAVVFRGTLFLLFRWKDPTETKRLETPITSADMPPRGRGLLVSGIRREGDQLSVLLPMEGTRSVDPWAGEEGRWDWWEWTAAVSDCVGHAADRFWFVSKTRWPGAPESMEFNGVRLWRLGAEDEGQSIFPRPPEGAAPEAAIPTGSAADVLARGRWKDGEWTLEVARALSTSNSDDMDLSGASGVLLGLQVNSPLPYQPVTPLLLLLPPPEPDDRQGPFPEPRRGSATGR